MGEKLEDIINPRKLRDITKIDIELEGITELYGKPIDFLGVSPFFVDYGFLPKKTYLVLPHFKEKFKLQETEYSNDTVIIKVKGSGKEKTVQISLCRIPYYKKRDNGNAKSNNGYSKCFKSKT